MSNPGDPPTVSSVEEAYQIRVELKAGIEKLGERLPKNTLDRLIDGLGGPKEVAEVSYRCQYSCRVKLYTRRKLTSVINLFNPCNKSVVFR